MNFNQLKNEASRLQKLMIRISFIRISLHSGERKKIFHALGCLDNILRDEILALEGTDISELLLSKDASIEFCEKVIVIFQNVTKGVLKKMYLNECKTNEYLRKRETYIKKVACLKSEIDFLEKNNAELKLAKIYLLSNDGEAVTWILDNLYNMFNTNEYGFVTRDILSKILETQNGEESCEHLVKLVEKKRKLICKKINQLGMQIHEMKRNYLL